MTFGEKLYRLRKERGMSQEALAQELGVSRQAGAPRGGGGGGPRTGGARGGNARREANRMPRTAMLRKACGPRSGDFHTAEQWESNGIFRLRKSPTRLFRQAEGADRLGPHPQPVWKARPGGVRRSPHRFPG